MTVLTWTLDWSHIDQGAVYQAVQDLVGALPGVIFEMEMSAELAGTLYVGVPSTAAQAIHELPFPDRTWDPAQEVSELLATPADGLHVVAIEFRLHADRVPGRACVVLLDADDDRNYACWPIALPLASALMAHLGAQKTTPQ